MSIKISEHLKQYAAIKNKTQKEMAAILDISYRTYQNIEKTGIVKSVDTLQNIIDKTGYVNTQKNALNKHTPQIFSAHDSANSPALSEDMVKELMKNNSYLSLAQANFSLAQKDVAASHLILAELLKKERDKVATAGDLQENRQGELATVRALRELVLEIGSGKQWPTRGKVQEHMNTLSAGYMPKKKATDKHPV